MVKRDIFEDVVTWLEEERIIVVKGARQTGKTTLLLQLKQYVEENGCRAVYFSIDREYNNPVFSSPKRLTKFLNDQYAPSPTSRVYLFFDEFENRGITDIMFTTTGCAGLCAKEPMITVEIEGSAPVKYGDLTPEKAIKILDEHIIGGHIVEDFAIGIGSERVG